MVEFKGSLAESRLITKIAQRAIAMANANGIDADFVTLEMDITACHCNGCPLDLKKLLAFPDADFGHDVFGIRRYIDRDTGKIDPARFVPRCSLGVPASA